MTMANEKHDPKANPQQPIAGMRPGGPNNPARGYTPGANTVGPTTGAESADDLTGGWTGGDIDLPDITGRGTTEDLTRHGDTGQGTPNTALRGPENRTGDRKT